MTWPKAILIALGKAIYERGVDVEIVLCNPWCIPGSLSRTGTNYGNGWSCVDVASEIVKTIRRNHRHVNDARLRALVKDNLRICFVRHNMSSSYEDGMSIGLHSKHFIIDDICCYIGSQNLYVCDLAEWGIVIDDKEATQEIKETYFDRIWKNSYIQLDCDVDAVMDGLGVDRNGEFKLFNTTTHNDMMNHGGGDEFYDIDESECERTTTCRKYGDLESKSVESRSIASGIAQCFEPELSSAYSTTPPQRRRSKALLWVAITAVAVAVAFAVAVGAAVGIASSGPGPGQEGCGCNEDANSMEVSPDQPPPESTVSPPASLDQSVSESRSCPCLTFS